MKSFENFYIENHLKFSKDPYKEYNNVPDVSGFVTANIGTKEYFLEGCITDYTTGKDIKCPWTTGDLVTWMSVSKRKYGIVGDIFSKDGIHWIEYRLNIITEKEFLKLKEIKDKENRKTIIGLSNI